MMKSTIEYIESLERSRELDSNCRTCQEVFYPQLKQGRRMPDIFAPRHKAKLICESGNHPHCTCDTCF